jgi:hypothetical protein
MDSKANDNRHHYKAEDTRARDEDDGMSEVEEEKETAPL